MSDPVVGAPPLVRSGVAGRVAPSLVVTAEGLTGSCLPRSLVRAGRARPAPPGVVRSIDVARRLAPTAHRPPSVPDGAGPVRPIDIEAAGRLRPTALATLAAPSRLPPARRPSETD